MTDTQRHDTVATLLRQTIKKQEVSTIRSELEYIKMYVELFRLRYPDMITFRTSADEAVMNYGILANLMQLLVENCIVHGFNPSIENYYIEVHIYELQGKLIVEIKDNGSGITTSTLKNIQQRFMKNDEKNAMNSIGLTNVSERIKLVYGHECGLSIFGIASCKLFIMPVRFLVMAQSLIFCKVSAER